MPEIPHVARPVEPLRPAEEGDQSPAGTSFEHVRTAVARGRQVMTGIAVDTGDDATQRAFDRALEALESAADRLVDQAGRAGR